MKGIRIRACTKGLIAGAVLSLVLMISGCDLLGGEPELIAGPGHFATIQATIDASSDGDEVIVLPGTYRENIDFGGRDITVRSATFAELDELSFEYSEGFDIVAETIIDGQSSGSVVTFENGERTATLSGFTITNGKYGISVLKSSEATIADNVITNNTDGGIYLYTTNTAPSPSRATITGNTISNNASSVGAGIMLSYLAEATIEDNTISGNTATDGNHGGGGIALYHFGTEVTTAIKNNTISGNTAYRRGGGVYVNGSGTTALITGNTFTGNKAAEGSHSQMAGGAIYASGTLANCTVYDNVFENNHADWLGGALYFDAGEVFGRDTTVMTEANYTDHNTFSGNTAGDAGDDLYIDQ